MTFGRIYVAPPIWSDDRLEAWRRDAVANFINERNAEGGERYQARFKKNLKFIKILFAETNNLLDFGTGKALSISPNLVEAARYLGGPPISADDLNTLAGESIANRNRLDTKLAQKAAEVILTVLDSERFPWLFSNPVRKPTEIEYVTAIRWTAGLMTVQQVQTARRGELAMRQQEAVEQALSQLGFVRVPRRPIDITGGLTPGEFCPEAHVVGIKCDIPVGLRDGRFLFIECKVSNSATNSVKRLNREVGGKAQQWRSKFGDRAITAAVLAGVFKLRNLKDAQAAGVTLFWEHDLAPLADFLNAAV